MSENVLVRDEVKRSARFMLWIFIWTASMVLIDKAALYEWVSSSSIFLVAIVLNALLGVGAIFAFMRYLKQSDELQRKIQLDALALALGVGFVGSFTYSLLVTTGFVAEEEVSDLLLLMALTYMTCVIGGLVRYR